MFPHQQMAAGLLPAYYSPALGAFVSNYTCTCLNYSGCGASICIGGSCAFPYTQVGCDLNGSHPITVAMVAQVQPGDPIEQLQALRKQLEVALAGVEGQLEALRKQREAGEKK